MSTCTVKVTQLLQKLDNSSSFTRKGEPGGCMRDSVAPDIEGVLATENLDAGETVGEIEGIVCLAVRKEYNPSVFCYDGLSKGLPEGRCLAVDAQSSHAIARFTRRSCRPNCSIEHELVDGQIRFFIVAQEKITTGTEITIPFDKNSLLSDSVLPCACPHSGTPGCPKFRPVSGFSGDLPAHESVLHENAEDTEGEEEEDVDYSSAVTRCICGLQDDHGLMVECEKCRVWQHTPCLGIKSDGDSDDFLCERCQLGKPLPFTPYEARRRLARELGRPFERLIAGMDAKEPFINVYTMKAKMMLSRFSDTETMEDISKDWQLQPIANNGHGLFSTKDINAGSVITEIPGSVCRAHEAHIVSKYEFHPFVFVYDGLELARATARRDLPTVDARRLYSAGRHVKRCCRPNATLHHEIKDELLRLFIVASESIPKGYEITIPFDDDFDSNGMTDLCQCKAANCLLRMRGHGHRRPAGTLKMSVRPADSTTNEMCDPAPKMLRQVQG